MATGIWHGGTNVNLVIHPPKANAGGPYVSPVDTAVNFTATASDYGSDASTYQWDWDNDGTYDATGASQSHTWTTAGTYTVGLKVTDAQGGVGTTTASVIVYSLEGLTGQTYKDAPIAITVNGVSSPYSSVVKYAGSPSAPTNAGTYAVVVEIYNGATLVNTITGNNLVIDKLAITVTAVTDSKPYDGANTSSGVPTITSGSLAGDDAVTWTQTFDNKNVGTGKTLTPAGTVSDGNGGNNYAVTFVNNTTGAITVRAITVSAATDTKAYDGANTSSRRANDHVWQPCAATMRDLDADLRHQERRHGQDPDPGGHGERWQRRQQLCRDVCHQHHRRHYCPRHYGQRGHRHEAL